MSSRGIAVAGLVALLAAVVWWWMDDEPVLSPEPEYDSPVVEKKTSVAVPPVKTPEPPPPLPPASIPERSPKQAYLLAHYGSSSSSASDDLQLVESALQSFWQLYKNPDLLRVGSNEAILRVLMGDNPEGFEFVSADNSFIDEQGRLVDRWGTPLRFHPISMVNIEVISAGPDRRFGTDDDVDQRAKSKGP